MWVLCLRPTLYVLPFLLKHVVMSSCFEVERSRSGVGPGGRISRVLANSPNQRLGRNVARRLNLNSVSVKEWKCSGDSACRSLRR